MEPLQTFLIAVETDRDTLISTGNDLKVRFHNIDWQVLSPERLNFHLPVFHTPGRRVEDPEMESETLRSQNASINKHNHVLLINFMDRVSTTSGRANTHTFFSSLPHLYYRAVTEQGKNILTCARKEVSELKTASKTFSQGWTGRNECPEDTEPSSTDAHHVFPLSFTDQTHSRASFVASVIGAHNIF